MAKNNSNISGLVLLAKQAGRTSYSSLFEIKKALGTSKVGHTGTLDSFAQGLLVVCVGRLTRLVSHITDFDKSYEAVIEFGKETDTLDYTGQVVKTSNLPTLENLILSLEKFKGNINQIPPSYSALKINGQRASDLVRSGQSVDLKPRPISIYSNKILQVKFEDGRTIDSNSFDFDNLINFIAKKTDENNLLDIKKKDQVNKISSFIEVMQKKVQYSKIDFNVSKGTYIRCLARDIASECNSTGHLLGLMRTRIGCFSLEDACGIKFINDFSIDSVLKNVLKNNESKDLDSSSEQDRFDFLISEIKENLLQMNPRIAIACGLKPITIFEKYKKDFINGKLLNQNFFSQKEFENIKYSVFSEKKEFLGVIQFKENRFNYEYVISTNV